MASEGNQRREMWAYKPGGPRGVYIGAEPRRTVPEHIKREMEERRARKLESLELEEMEFRDRDGGPGVPPPEGKIKAGWLEASELSTWADHQVYLGRWRCRARGIRWCNGVKVVSVCGNLRAVCGPCRRPACNDEWVEFADQGWYPAIPCSETYFLEGGKKVIWHGWDVGRRATDLERDLNEVKRGMRARGEEVPEHMFYSTDYW